MNWSLYSYKTTNFGATKVDLLMQRNVPHIRFVFFPFMRGYTCEPLTRFVIPSSISIIDPLIIDTVPHRTSGEIYFPFCLAQEQENYCIVLLKAK